MANRFINYRKFKELTEASKNGNPKAKAIIDKYMEDKPDMDAIDRLMEDYYSEAGIDTLKQAMPEPEPEPVPHKPFVSDPYTEVPDEALEGDFSMEPVPEEIPGQPESEIKEPEMPEVIPEPEPEIPETEIAEPEIPAETEAFPDISADLDRELDGLFDADDFADSSFADFLDAKRKNGLRAKKDASYFKAFDPKGREAYLEKKKAEYGDGFANRLHDIKRHYDDMSGSLDVYGTMVSDLPDDGIQIDVGLAEDAYGKLVGDGKAMSAFGRSWDKADTDEIHAKLNELVAEYGKANILAVLNTIRDDNEAWKAEAEGRISDSISKYGKHLDSLLK